MKKSNCLSFLLILATAMFASSGIHLSAAPVTDSINFIAYHGKVLDRSTNSVLPFATVEVDGSNIATVTNIDGEFIVKIPKETNASSLKISYIGFSNKYVPLKEFEMGKSLTIELNPSTLHLQAVTIRPQNAEDLIRQILNNIGKNYSIDPIMMKAFYRETIKNRHNYVAISEAVLDIYKSSYKNEFDYDQVKIDKGRKSGDVEKMDTVLFKLQGGPAITLMLDIVKNPYILLHQRL